MKWKVTAIFIFVAVSFKIVDSKPYLKKNGGNDIESCPSPIYCQGQLLDTVQLAAIYNDSKTFVDMKLVNDVDVTLENFRKLLNDTGNNPTKLEITKFVQENFVSGNATEIWTPTDFNSNPSFLSKINDSDVRQFAQNIVNIWPNLGRKVSPDVLQNPDRYSIFHVTNGFIVPGGRFREFYYWDSYWIIKGLLISEMYETARGMLENFCSIIEQYGFIPNGARVYYLNRSHPPLFALMIKNYLERTGNTDWLKSNIGYLETELTFWLKNRTVAVEKDGVKYQLAHYSVDSNTPRPESYKEDKKTCQYYDGDEEKQKYCYHALKSGAESGWDFSTRWFYDANGSVNTNLTHIDTPRSIQVDLNSILCRSFRELSNFYKILGDTEKQAEWLDRSDTWKKAIENVFYNETEGIWFDYDSQNQVHRKYFYPSNFVPLWAQSYDDERKDEYGQRAADYFIKKGVNQYQGGIPTSLDLSGEQWDLRNAWPPLQEFVVLGLLNTENEDAVKLSKLFASRWVSANMKGYKETQVMFEKYDAIDPGKFGGGGEYTVQPGFGWTNGVVLSFIEQFYSDKNKV